MANAKFESDRGTRTYITGFILSLFLTVAAYFLVAHHVNSRRVILVAIFGLAVVQLLVQLIFFLHLGRESKPRWNLLVFSFMAIVLVILVFGSLWIMYSLNYHMPAPNHQSDSYILKDEGFK